MSARDNARQPTRRDWLQGHAIGAMAYALGLSAMASPAWANTTVDFFRAIRRDDGRTIDFMLRRGLDPNIRDEHSRIALIFALEIECENAAKAILGSRKVDVNAVNAKGETPLMMACLRGYLSMAHELVARGADVNRQGFTPLHYAASGSSEQQPAIVAFLIEQHAYIDAESPNASTPLMLAAQYGLEEVVQLLLNEGADARLRNQLGLTALDFARRSERQAVVERILRGVQRQQPNQGRW